MILGFHLRLAARSLRRTPLFALAMMLSLAVGSAVWLIARTTIVAQGRLALPGRPLYHVGIVRNSETAAATKGDLRTALREVANATLSWRDAEALLARAPGRRTLTWSAHAVVATGGATTLEEVRLCSRDFFALFELELARGQVWESDDDGANRPDGASGADARRAGGGLPPVVIDGAAAARLFGRGSDAIGRTLRVQDHDFRVVGVLAPYRRLKVFDFKFLIQSRPDALYLPAAWGAMLELRPDILLPGAPFGPRYADLVASDAQWLHVWIELPDAAARDAYRAAAAAYVSGLPPARPAVLGARLLSVDEWQRTNYRTFNGYQLFYLFAALLLAACVLNLMRLLLAKFSSRAHLIGVHRALGASKRSIFLQHVTEAALVGLGAGLIGLGLSLLGFSVINTLVSDRPVLFALDAAGAGVLLLAAVGSGVAAGVYPAWRTSNLEPALFLRRA